MSCPAGGATVLFSAKYIKWTEVYLFAAFVPQGIIMKVPSEMTWFSDDVTYQVLDQEDIGRYFDDFG